MPGGFCRLRRTFGTGGETASGAKMGDIEQHVIPEGMPKMKPTRVVAVVVGCLLLLPGLALLFGGGGLGLTYAFGRDRTGYVQEQIKNLRTSTVAVTVEDVALQIDADSPRWLVEQLHADLRLRATGTNPNRPIFVGIGPAAQVATYLRGVAHDEVINLPHGGTPTYRTSPGTSLVAAPTTQSFWVASTTGAGAQELTWKTTDGRWAVVVMNADGSPGVSATAAVGIHAGFLLPLSLLLFAPGVLNTAGAVALILFAASGRRGGRGTGRRQPADVEGSGVPSTAGIHSTNPVTLTARLDPGLSRWKWLIKWFLALPHLLVLAFLWPAFLVTTVVAGFTIVLTGSYPRSLFEFNVGVLRWSWRVSYYATSGGIGTDKYPPFTLSPAPDYPATLEITYPQRLSRGLALVKWWLLAVPHYVVVALLVGWGGWTSGGDHEGFQPVGGGVLGLLVLVAGVVLLLTGTYPKALFDLTVGLNRWVYRVIAYAALMTDQYPPFRLDQGGDEPVPVPPAPQPPTAGQVDPRPLVPVSGRGTS